MGIRRTHYCSNILFSIESSLTCCRVPYELIVQLLQGVLLDCRAKCFVIRDCQPSSHDAPANSYWRLCLIFCSAVRSGAVRLAPNYSQMRPSVTIGHWWTVTKK